MTGYRGSLTIMSWWKRNGRLTTPLTRDDHAFFLDDRSLQHSLSYFAKILFGTPGDKVREVDIKTVLDGVFVVRAPNLNIVCIYQ